MTDPYRQAFVPPVRKLDWLRSDSEKKVFVSEGDVWEFLFDVSTRAGFVHPKGSKIAVMDRTGQTPHHEIGPRNHNWICQTQFDISVWATLEQCIERGLLKKVATVGHGRIVLDVVTISMLPK